MFFDYTMITHHHNKVNVFFRKFRRNLYNLEAIMLLLVNSLDNLIHKTCHIKNKPTLFLTIEIQHGFRYLIFRRIVK